MLSTDSTAEVLHHCHLKVTSYKFGWHHASLSRDLGDLEVLEDEGHQLEAVVILEVEHLGLVVVELLVLTGS